MSLVRNYYGGIIIIILFNTLPVLCSAVCTRQYGALTLTLFALILPFTPCRSHSPSTNTCRPRHEYHRTHCCPPLLRSTTALPCPAQQISPPTQARLKLTPTPRLTLLSSCFLRFYPLLLLLTSSPPHPLLVTSPTSPLRSPVISPSKNVQLARTLSTRRAAIRNRERLGRPLDNGGWFMIKTATTFKKRSQIPFSTIFRHDTHLRPAISNYDRYLI